MPLLLHRGTLDGTRNRSWQMRSYLAEDADAWNRFTRASALQLAIRRVAQRVAPSLYADARIGKLLGAAHIARVYLAVAADVRGGTRLTEKTPTAAPWSGQLLAWFPGSRLLYLHRHPVDVLTSYWLRATVDQPDWASLTVEEFAERYRTRTADATAWAQRRPDAVRMLRYDDLVTAPEATLQSICEFVGTAFDPAFVKGSAKAGEFAHIKLWDDPVTTTKHWSDYITAEQVTQLEDLLAPELTQLGYERRS